MKMPFYRAPGAYFVNPSIALCMWSLVSRFWIFLGGSSAHNRHHCSRNHCHWWAHDLPELLGHRHRRQLRLKNTESSLAYCSARPKNVRSHHFTPHQRGLQCLDRRQTSHQDLKLRSYDPIHAERWSLRVPISAVYRRQFPFVRRWWNQSNILVSRNIDLIINYTLFAKTN